MTSQSQLPRGRRKFDPVKLSAVTKEIIMDPLQLPNDLKELNKAKLELHALQKHYIRAGKYSEAQDTQRILRSVESKIRLKEARSGEKQAQRERYAEVRVVVDKILDDWNKNYDEFIAATENQMRAIVEMQRQELDAFDGTAPERLSPQYKRISPTLLELRGREKALAATKRYSAALRLKKKNDAEQERLEREQFTKMQEDWLARRRKIIARQEEQLRIFVDHAESTRTRMLNNRKTLIDGHVKRMNMISAKLGEDAAALDNMELSEERQRVVSELESAYPVPLVRGPAFTAVRQQKQKADKQQIEDEQSNETEEEEMDEIVFGGVNRCSFHKLE